jgi:hypothetical protein
VADVEFDDVGDRDDGLHVVVMQAMPGIHLQPVGMRVFRRDTDALQFMFALRHAVRLGIFPGMQFHHRRAGAACRIDLHRVRVDEQRHADACRCATLARRFDVVERAYHVQAAFGGQFLAAFRHQA